MNNSKLYNMAAKIAVDKLAPKPIHIAISMQGGGGLSNLNENIVYRYNGGGFGFTEDDVAIMQASPSEYMSTDYLQQANPNTVDMLHPSTTRKGWGTGKGISYEDRTPLTGSYKDYPYPSDPGETEHNIWNRVQQNLRLQGPPPALDRLSFDKWTPKEQEQWKDKNLHKFGIYDESMPWGKRPESRWVDKFHNIKPESFEGTMPVIKPDPDFNDPIETLPFEGDLFNELKDTGKFSSDSHIRDFIHVMKSYGKRAASGGGISSLNENIVYRQGAGRLVTDTWNRIPNFVKQYGKGIVNKILYETTGKTLSDTTREDMTKGEVDALEEGIARAVVTGEGEFGTLGTDFEGWVGLGEKGNVRRDAEAIVGGATVSWNPETGQYEFKDKYDFPVYEAPGSFRDEVKSINEWLEERGNTRDQIVDPTKGLVGALLGNFFPQNRLFGAGLSLGSKIVGKSENKRYFDENDPEDLDKIRHIPYAGAFHTSMGISPQEVQDISEKHDFWGVLDPLQKVKHEYSRKGTGSGFGLVGGDLSVKAEPTSSGYSYDPNTDTTFLDGEPIDTTAAFKHGGQTMPGGLSGINENIVYRQGGGPPGTKLWDKTKAEPKVNHNGGLSLMMKGDDDRYYTRGGTDQRGLYYPGEVRENEVSDEPALHPADEAYKDIVDYTGAKGPIPFPTSFEIQPPTTRPRPLPISPAMKPIPSASREVGMPSKLTRRNLDSDETIKPAKRNIFNTSLPQAVGGGTSRNPAPFRTGSPYPAYDNVLAQLELIEREKRGGPPSVLPQYSYSQGVDPGPGIHDPRGIDPNYISKLQEQGTYTPQNYDPNRYNQAAEILSEDNPADDFYSYEDTDFTGFGMKHGGGISSLNDSININGQPHRLVWANPKEERVLKDMGGSGKKVLGKPAYYYGSFGADPMDITEDMTAEDINIGMESGDISTFGMGETAIDQPGGPDYPTAMSLYDPKEYSKMYKGIDDVYTEAGTERVAPITFAELGATRKEDEGAKIAYMNQHLANYPGGRRDPVTQELFEADKDYDRAIKKYGSSMLQTLRDSYAGNQDVFGAMFGHATKLAQDRLREAYNKEIDKFPEDFVDSDKYRESIVDAVLSDPAKAFEKFGLTDVTKSTGLLPEAKIGERGWRDWVGELATPMAVRGLDALSKGIPFMMDIWGTGKVNGEGVYIKKDGTLIPFTSETERGNIESGSLRGENEDPKKLIPRPVQVASAEEVTEKEPSALERLLDARSETSSLDKLYEDMKARVNPLYNRNIFA